MSENSKKEPKLRFPGFTDAWEQRDLGEVVQITMGQSPDSSNYTDNPKYHILVQGNADMKNGRVVPRVWTTQVTKEAEAGDLILSVRAPVGDIGKTDYDVVLGRGVAAIKGNEFIFQQLGKLKTTGYWTRYSTGSTFESINSNDIKKAKIMVPSEAEQDKIGEFFANIDHLITLHQRKLSDVQNLKAGLLQKMFPKNDANVPEIRFPGFTDVWEQRNVSELAEETYGGGTPKTSVEEYWTGDIPWIQSSDLVQDQVSDVIAKKYITADAVKSSATKLVPADSIAIVTRVGVGKLAYMPYEYATSQDFLSLSNLTVDHKFSIYAVYKKLQSELHAVQGTSIKGITKDELLSKKILVPKDKGEQEKIGAFFANLDHLITLHQRKLEHLQEQKKSLLQQMFV
ncbi:restriction endonuclease subunit S [Rummeliibacillus suwonensis]|uniref:restriction endonuclease subunit S n=1 Tax=Rummeliibacillus suwonensis TaxID=1306154 RepID=UPI001AB005A1|nr:restriction endonuclease subunit S [Rummeliibacillus suwonensis]MBO2535638.1 restriction endonuclease subunit S [Rummeliibacillus suwonensis]